MSYPPRYLPDGSRRRTPSDRRRQAERAARLEMHRSGAVPPAPTPRPGPPIRRRPEMGGEPK